jgi:class 3 adenylate cyclase
MYTTESRQVTVLNCDLVNSVGLTLELGVEDYSELLREFFDRIRAATQPWRGFEHSSHGDGVYFLFGYPNAEETAAENAVRAALAILTNLRQSTRFRDRLHARIGIATSMLLFGAITHHKKHDAIGDAMNRVARLQELVESDAIAISHETRLLLGDTFKYENLGLRSLKGYSDPLQAWEVVRERSRGTRFDKLRGVRRASLIGRDHEWSALNSLWEQAQGGRGQIAVLSGEAGIGKSRLARELVEKVNAKQGDVWVLQCEPHLVRSQLAPVGAYLLQRAKINPDDSEAVKLKKLANSTNAVFQPAFDEALSFLAEFLSIRHKPKQDRRDVSSVLHLRKLLDAITRLLVGRSQDAPRLVVVEDIHWADDSTLKLLDRLSEAVPNGPNLLVLTTRGRHVARILADDHVVGIPVSALSESDAETLVSELTSGPKLPVSQIRAILDWSDGVPLDIEEHTRVELLEWSQRFSSENSAGTMVGNPGHFSIPATRRDAIKSHLDRLDRFSQETAQAAAVIGKEFSHRQLLALLDCSNRALTDSLDALESADVIRKSDIGGTEDYCFRHARYRDAAYESLPRDRRQAHHSRIVDFLRREQPGQVKARPELFAHHFEAAGDASTAIRYWIAAGNLSSVKGGYLEAVVQYERAVALLESGQGDLTSDPEIELQLQISLGTAFEVRDGFSCVNARKHYERALQLCRAQRNLTDSRNLFATYSGFGSMLMVRADFKTAREIASECRAEAEARQSNLGRVIAKRLEGGASVLQGQLAQGIRDLNVAVELYDAHYQETYASDEFYALDHKVTAKCYLALAKIAKGEIKSALETIRQCEEFANQRTNLHSRNYVLTYHAAIHHLLDDQKQTIEIATRSRNMAIEQGFGSWEGMSRILLGYAHLTEGELQKGKEEFLLGRKIHEKGMEARQYLPFVISVAARMQSLSGDIKTALLTNDRAIEIAETTDEQWYVPELLRLKGELLLQQQATEAAIECFEEAQQRSLGNGSNLWALRSSANLARVSGDAELKTRSLAEVSNLLSALPEISGSPDEISCRELLSQ